MKPLELQLGKNPDENIVLPFWFKIPWFLPFGVFLVALLIGCFYPVGWVYCTIGVSFCVSVIQGLLLIFFGTIYLEIKKLKKEKPNTRMLEIARDELLEAVRDAWSWFLSLWRAFPDLCARILSGVFFLLCVGFFIACIGLVIYGFTSISLHGLMVIGVILLILILFKK